MRENEERFNHAKGEKSGQGQDRGASDYHGLGPPWAACEALGLSHQLTCPVGDKFPFQARIHRGLSVPVGPVAP